MRGSESRTGHANLHVTGHRPDDRERHEANSEESAQDEKAKDEVETTSYRRDHATTMYWRAGAANGSWIEAPACSSLEEVTTRLWGDCPLSQAMRKNRRNGKKHE